MVQVSIDFPSGNPNGIPKSFHIGNYISFPTGIRIGNHISFGQWPYNFGSQTIIHQISIAT